MAHRLIAVLALLAVFAPATVRGQDAAAPAARPALVAAPTAAVPASAQLNLAAPAEPEAPPAAAAHADAEGAVAALAAPSGAADLEQRVADLEAYVNNGARAGDKSKVSGAGPGHNGWMMVCAALVWRDL